MSRASPRSEVRRSIFEGITKANTEYKKCSGEDFKFAPEYFVCSKIFESLSRIQPGWVSLEENVARIYKESGIKKRGTLKKNLRKKGRFDIVLRYANKKPRVVIEVKHPLSVNDASRIDKDIERICIILHDSKYYGGSLKEGFFCFFSTEKKSDDIENALERIDAKLDKIQKQCELVAKKHRCKTELVRQIVKGESKVVNLVIVHPLRKSAS